MQAKRGGVHVRRSRRRPRLCPRVRGRMVSCTLRVVLALFLSVGSIAGIPLVNGSLAAGVATDAVAVPGAIEEAQDVGAVDGGALATDEGAGQAAGGEEGAGVGGEGSQSGVAADGQGAGGQGAGDGAASGSADGQGTGLPDAGDGEGTGVAADGGAAGEDGSDADAKAEADANAADAAAEGTLVSPTMALDDTKSITEIKIRYLAVLEPGDAGYDPNAQPLAYDPSPDALQKPCIGKVQGRMKLYATVVWSDGTEQDAEQANAGITWRVSETCDPDGSALASVLATVDDAGTLAALQTGNGTVKVRCAANYYPDFAGQDIVVKLENNERPQEVEEVTASYALPYFRSEGAGSFSPYYEGSSRPLVSSTYGDCTFDMLVYFSDGSQKFASELGADMHWVVTGSYDLKGDASQALAKVSPNGMVSALNAGNGFVTLSGSVLGLSVSASAYIEGNSPSPDDPVPQALTFRYTDVNNPLPLPYNSNKLPEIITSRGSMQFIPLIRWSDGTLTEAADSAYDVRWTEVGATDLKGNAVSTLLAFASKSGKVWALNAGNGIVEYRCSLEGADIPASPSTVKVEIRGNDDSTYVTDVEILRSDGTPYGDDALDVTEVNGRVQLYVRVTYADDTVKSTLKGDYIKGLKWENFRGMTSSKDLYSNIDATTGYLSTDSGFTECHVVATVVGGGFYDNDVSDSLRVYETHEEDRVGSSSEITVHVIEESEYAKFGSDAVEAETKTITAGQMSAMTYSDWYTFRSRGGGWGTLYAQGASISNFLALAGIDAQDMQFMLFEDAAGYTGDSGFYSADVILGSRYRYSNYYMHVVSSDPSYLGQGAVVPMIATQVYFDYGNDYNGSGFFQMSSDSCLRLVLGMYGVDASNARYMVKCVADVTVIVKDRPDEEPEEPPEPPEVGPGSPGLSDDGGGTGSESGAASEGMGGGTGAGGMGQRGTDLDADPSDLYLRELMENEPLTALVTERDNPWRIVALAVVIAALVASMIGKHVRYRLQVRDGERIRRHEQASDASQPGKPRGAWA